MTSRRGGRPRGVLPYYLGTQFTVLIALIMAPGRAPTGPDWMCFGFLLVSAVASAELTRLTEKIRRYFADTPHVNMTSVWLFAGALILPTTLAALLVGTVYGHLWLRVWRRMANRPAYRVVFSASTLLAACLVVPPVLRSVGATMSAMDDTRLLLGVTLSALAFATVNLVLVMVGVKLHEPDRPFLALVGPWTDNALELATLCLGGITAVLLQTHPVLVLLTLLPVVVLHRSVLVRQLEQLVAKDGKTGLLTDAEWRNRAVAQLAKAKRERQSVSVLMIDLDHFKRTNDSYGHLAGDATLRAVADVVSTEVRGYGSVGRFGGEEFVVLLPGVREAESVAIAERIRGRVAELEVHTATTNGVTAITGLSVSIGVAAVAADGVVVDRLLLAADRALYRAKGFGRNQVVSAAEAG